MGKTFNAFLLCIVSIFCALWLTKEELTESGQKTYATELSSSAEFFTFTPSDGKELTSSGLPVVFPFDFKGESVFVKGECDVKGIADKYDATVLKVVRTGDITEYYMFSPRLGRVTYAGGERVNLHVAVSPCGYTIGTPFIFFGY